MMAVPRSSERAADDEEALKPANGTVEVVGAPTELAALENGAPTESTTALQNGATNEPTTALATVGAAPAL